MEDKKTNIVVLSILATLTGSIIVARIVLKLSKPFFLVCGINISLIAALIIYAIIRRKDNLRRRQFESQLVSEGKELRIEYSFLRKVAGLPTKFRYKELVDATDDFRLLIGQGASASVFKGILKDGTSIAVKRIEGENQNGERVFKAEVAAIASVHHVNLVRLHGYCTINPDGPRFLVYDFIPNGSLDCWIFPTNKRKNCFSGGCLSWELRYKVAVDVAKALSYLHNDCRSRVLHLDVKPENILLDENFNAVVSDFGVSKLMRKDLSRVVTTVRGTRGYLAPEWLLQNGVSEKSDIYSYGMVLLEMIGGRRNITFVENENERCGRKWEYFPRILKEKMNEGKLMDVLDWRLLEEGRVDEREVKRLVNVAFWCIQEKPRLRPSMDNVVEMLDGRVAVAEPPDTPMIVVDILAIDDQEEQSQDHCHKNYIPAKNLAMQARRQLGLDGDGASSSMHSFAMSIVSPR